MKIFIATTRRVYERKLKKLLNGEGQADGDATRNDSQNEFSDRDDEGIYVCKI